MYFNTTTAPHPTGASKLITPRVFLASVIAITVGLTSGCGKGSSNEDPAETTTAVLSDQKNKEIFSRTLFKDLQETAADGQTKKYPCGTCHSDNAENSIKKNFSNPDLDIAYNAVKNNLLVDLANPSQSTLLSIIKPGSDHFCSKPGCTDDYTSLLGAIKEWANEANAIQNTTVTASAIESKPTSFGLSEKVSVTKKRVSDGLVALYLFRDSSGTNTTVQNEVDRGTDFTSLNLSLNTTAAGKLDTARVKWISDTDTKNFTQGIQNINGAAKITNAEGNKRIFDAIVGNADAPGSYAYTIEAWVTPDPAPQRATLINYSKDSGTYNFSLGRARNDWTYRNNSTPTVTAMTTTGSILKPSLQHIVATFDHANGRQLYLNGVNTELAEAIPTDGTPPPSSYDISANWVNDGFAFVIGNETNANTPWKGNIYLIALYKRALSPEEINKNFTVGYTDPTVLRFDIQDVSNVPNGQIEIEADRFDDNSYKFSRPVFVGDASSIGNGLRIQGIQIKVNDSIPTVGQGFRNVESFVTTSNAQLSSIGTTISTEKGINNDVFTLVFETLGGSTNPPPATTPGELPIASDARKSADIPQVGIRTFDQIRDTMSTLTGADKFAGNFRNVNSQFALMREQLPGSPNPMAFLAAQQVAIAKLAGLYCDAMMANSGPRDAFFTGKPTALNYNATPTSTTTLQSVFANTSVTNYVATTLFDKMIGSGLSNQPDRDTVITKLSSMMTTVSSNPNLPTNPAPTAAKVIAGACTAVLASSAVMVH